MLFLLLTGCLDSSFDGTWLFQLEREYDLAGDCADDGDDTGGGGGEYTSTGTENVWVDIYSTGGGGLVVLFEAPLVGEAKGSDLSASYETSDEGEDWSETEAVELSATLKGGMLEGEVTTSEEQESGGDTYTCAQTVAFTGMRTTTSPDEIAGN